MQRKSGMIAGIGIDIIEVERMGEKLAKENGFVDKVFSKQEQQWCDDKPNRLEHYAARFAAKEAFLKATGKGMMLTYDLHKIEIVTDEDGKPLLVLRDELRTMQQVHGWKIHVSLSHIKSAACAVVVLTQ